jgi:Cu/Ag efflux pump CusA
MSQNQPKEGFNLSKWALDHPALTRYLMVVLMLLGFAAYFQLGQDEDPPFTFRVMVVRTYWPGATAQQVAEQVTDKIERTLQEVPYADKIRSYSKPGESQIIFQIKDSSRPNEVANIWYTVRKKVGDMRYTLPTGVQGPFFNDEFGDVYGVIYALESEGFSYAELKTFADDARQQLLRVPDVAMQGFDAFESTYDLAHFDLRMRVRGTPVPPQPAQVLGAVGIVPAPVGTPDARRGTHYIRPDGNAEQYRKGAPH